MKYAVWGFVVLLMILHQDNWNWEDTTLVFGFMPISLLYHAGISIGASIAWFLAINFAWPELDDDTPTEDTSSTTSNQGGAHA